MSDKELSDLSFNREECPKCGAVWLNGNHIWRTGNKGNEETLHNLVCSRTNDPQCINKKYKKGFVYKRDLNLLKSGILMSKNQVKKEELKVKVLKLKDEVYNEPATVWQKEKDLAHKYLNKMLDILEEYRY
jgi:hypothetical protein